MLKILRNRSAIVLIICGLVLVAAGVAAFLEQKSRDNNIRQTPSIKNINTLQKAVKERDAAVCDEIKGETRRDEVDYSETEVRFDKDTKPVSEAEARKRCQEAVAEVIDADRQRQQSQNSLR
jgi:hypothetical protein